MIDIVTVGAGGGSIARIDMGGVLQVGPQSAGAEPGPACYGKSLRPTVTDACVVNGIIDSDFFLGGKMKIHPQRSHRAIGNLAKQLNRDIHETAEGIINISVSSMERALRAITIEKGEDPRFFTLLPFGGAGGMVASLLAERLDIRRIIVPPYQGVFSALGMLLADFQKEFSVSFLQTYNRSSHDLLEKTIRDLSRTASTTLAEEGFAESNSALFSFLEMRYSGQSYEIMVPYTPEFVETFHQKHETLYSYRLNDEYCEIVNVRVVAVGRVAKMSLKKHRLQNDQAASKFSKKIFFNKKWLDTSFYERDTLLPGNRLNIPAVVTSDHATLVIGEQFRARIDEYGNIIMERSP